MKKSRFFENNPEALADMNNIISSNPDTWPQILRTKYQIIIDDHFWENNPLTSFGSGVDIHKAILKVAPKKKDLHFLVISILAPVIHWNLN